MATVRVLLVVLCLAFAGRGGVFDSGAVRDGRAYVAGRGMHSRPGGFNFTGRSRFSWLGNEENRAVAIVRAAQKEIGVCEVGENTGPRVDQYNAYVGLHKVAWCAAFVSWVHGQAGYKKPRTAWSPALFPAERQVKVPVAGAVLGIYYPHLKRIGHCGAIEKVKDELIFSIEGNTSVNGRREGNGVYRKIRHKRTVAAYSDWCQSK